MGFPFDLTSDGFEGTVPWSSAGKAEKSDTVDPANSFRTSVIRERVTNAVRPNVEISPRALAHVHAATLSKRGVALWELLHRRRRSRIDLGGTTWLVRNDAIAIGEVECARALVNRSLRR